MDRTWIDRTDIVAQLDRLYAQGEVQTRQMLALEQQVASLSQAVTDERERSRGLEETLQLFQASVSWRITAPLRALARSYPRIWTGARRRLGKLYRSSR